MKPEDTLEAARLNVMSRNTPSPQQAVARYFFLNVKENEIKQLIVVLTSDSATVQVPMREEDLELECFFERNMTPQEVAAAENSQLWKIFNTWNALISDHQKMGVSQQLLNDLIDRLPEPVCAAGRSYGVTCAARQNEKEASAGFRPRRPMPLFSYQEKKRGHQPAQ